MSHACANQVAVRIWPPTLQLPPSLLAIAKYREDSYTFERLVASDEVTRLERINTNHSLMTRRIISSIYNTQKAWELGIGNWPRGMGMWHVNGPRVANKNLIIISISINQCRCNMHNLILALGTPKRGSLTHI